MGNLNNTDKTSKNAEKELRMSDVSSSTVIEPISCEFGEDMKAHIEMMEWINNNFHKYATKMLMIPKERFGSK